MSAYTSLYQAAVILKSLPKFQAAKILARLQPADIRQVMDAVKELDNITADQISESLDKLNRDASRWKTDEAEDDVDTLLQTREDTYLSATDSTASSQGQPFGFFADAMPHIRDHLLKDEHPKNIAIVLSSLPPKLASDCMRSLEPITRGTVLKRLCELDRIDHGEVVQLSYTLQLRYHKLINQQPSGAGVNTAAELLSCSSISDQETMISMVEQSDPGLAIQLQQSILVIDDLLTLSDDDTKRLLSAIDTSCWAPALQGATLAVVSKILDNMAQKPAQLLNHEMAELGDLDPSITELARQSIFSHMLRLKKSGEINLPKSIAIVVDCQN